MDHLPADPVMQPDKERKKNVRTALILGSIALAFFFGFVIRRYFYA